MIQTKQRWYAACAVRVFLEAWWLFHNSIAHPFVGILGVLQLRKAERWVHRVSAPTYNAGRYGDAVNRFARAHALDGRVRPTDPALLRALSGDFAEDRNRKVGVYNGEAGGP